MEALHPFEAAGRAVGPAGALGFRGHAGPFPAGVRFLPGAPRVRGGRQFTAEPPDGPHPPRSRTGCSRTAPASGSRSSSKIAAALGGSLIISATPAAAATTAPSRIGRMVTQTTDGFDVLLTNKCHDPRSVKAVVSLAPDSSCHVMSKGTNVLYICHGVLGNYDRTVNC